MKKIFALILTLCFVFICCASAEEKPITQVVYAKVTSSSGGSVNLYQLRYGESGFETASSK